MNENRGGLGTRLYNKVESGYFKLAMFTKRCVLLFINFVHTSFVHTSGERIISCDQIICIGKIEERERERRREIR